MDGRKTILVVDDDPNLRILVEATLLSNPDYRILQAADGAEGLATARREKPAVILLDVAMPKMDGFTVCQALKADPGTRAVKVIMLTAAAQEGDRRRGEAAGADAYFTKPFSPLALLAKLDEVIGRCDPS